jgi:hypothetical protein
MSSGIPTANGREYRRTKIECEDAQRVGSRFIGWQVYWTAASGSRELPSALYFNLADRADRFYEDARRQGMMVSLGSLPGAACCKRTDLSPCKAAPLLTLGVLTFYFHSRLFAPIRG